MVFASSSPVLYPQSSSPPRPQPQPAPKKRKLFQPFVSEATPKRTRLVGGFEVDIDETAADENDNDNDDNDDNRPGQQPEERESASAPVDIDDITPASVNVDSVRPSFTRPLLRKRAARSIPLETSSGEIVDIPVRARTEAQTYESMIADRSKTEAGRAKKAYYGIEIHKLIEDARLQRVIDENEKLAQRQKAANEQQAPRPRSSNLAPSKPNAHLLWTEKYRARKFTELVGDERTHRQVLRWLKGWDSIVFPTSCRRAKPATKIYRDDHHHHHHHHNNNNNDNDDRVHRKILLLTGPPGLGKTTLAHVCARQAGYEVLEINASDDRSRDVVKGRIKDALGTETVRGIQGPGKERKIGRPACVVVDEVDGVVTGSGSSGEGGFMKALIELVQLDQRNSSQQQQQQQQYASHEGETKKRPKKGEKFRMLRPLILICNDVYAPSLRPLRTSSLAEIVHVGKPALEKVIARLKGVFEQERIPCDADAVRRICASAWGLGSRKQGSTAATGGGGEGDIRGVLVNAEWIAHKFRANSASSSSSSSSDRRPRLTRKWVEAHLAASRPSSSTTPTGARGLGRGGAREVIERIFTYGAGLPNPAGTTTALSADDARMVAESKSTSVGIADLHKRAAIAHVREMIDQCGDYDRVMTDCFATYPLQVYQDDVRLTKPSQAYDWLHFHDAMSSRVFAAHDWELLPYLSTGACGFHDLFAGLDLGGGGRRAFNWADDGKKDDAEAAAQAGGNAKSHHPFAGPRADFAANEAERANRTLLAELQERFQPELLRMFSSLDNIATELVPHAVGRMMAPNVKPVVVGGSGGGGGGGGGGGSSSITASVASVRKESEKRCVKNSVRVMQALDVRFEMVRVELEVGAAAAATMAKGGFAYRMEPPLDLLTSFHLDKDSSSSSSSSSAAGPVRYAVRQVLDQELRKERALRAAMLRQARSTALLGPTENKKNDDDDDEKENKAPTGSMSKAEQITQQNAAASKVKRDFFGRVVTNSNNDNDAGTTKTSSGSEKSTKDTAAEARRVWVSFHEGFSNAVRKPITLKELMEGFA